MQHKNENSVEDPSPRNDNSCDVHDDYMNINGAKCQMPSTSHQKCKSKEVNWTEFLSLEPQKMQIFWKNFVKH